MTESLLAFIWQQFGAPGILASIMGAGVAYGGVYLSRGLMANAAMNERVSDTLREVNETVRKQSAICDTHVRSQAELVDAVKSVVGEVHTLAVNIQTSHREDMRALIDLAMERRS